MKKNQQAQGSAKALYTSETGEGLGKAYGFWWGVSNQMGFFIKTLLPPPPNALRHRARWIPLRCSSEELFHNQRRAAHCQVWHLLLVRGVLVRQHHHLECVAAGREHHAFIPLRRASTFAAMQAQGSACDSSLSYISFCVHSPEGRCIV